MLRAFLFVCAAFSVTGHAYSTVVLSESPKILLLKDFVSDEECDYMMSFARPYLIRSQVVDERNPNSSVLDNRRTSEGMFFPQFIADGVIRSVEERIAALTQIPLENGEGIQVLHYSVGGEYAPHFDYFNPNTPGGQSVLARGGQRLATLIMYLNTPEAGGETIFPTLNLSVVPEKGTAVLFYNCTPDGVEDPRTLHGGAPVQAGDKWIATKWLHPRPFH